MAGLIANGAISGITGIVVAPLTGTGGADTLAGGDGRDRAVYTASSGGVSIDLGSATASGGHAAGDTLTSIEDITGSSFNDTLTGNGSDNELAGGLGNDTLAGGAGADILLGDNGNDRLSGGAGADTLQGGEGRDIADYSSSAVGVVVNLGLAGAQISAGSDADGDILVEIEDLLGGAGNDTLTGNAGDNAIDGGSGNDILRALAARTRWSAATASIPLTIQVPTRGLPPILTVRPLVLAATLRATCWAISKT
ncbi:MAG: calcium-binding protein [Phyllobacteriaceae bacterium]|nr:calcium-binding protein [Phyllobacteriaceae bacterium]